MKEVVIVSAARTPIGDFGGALKTVIPLDLMKTVMGESIKRAGIKKEDVGSVFVGSCFSPMDQNVARISSLLLGLPYETPGLTIN
jgi:acetyl-CoA C-acetyltransferase